MNITAMIFVGTNTGFVVICEILMIVVVFFEC